MLKRHFPNRAIYVMSATLRLSFHTSLEGHEHMCNMKYVFDFQRASPYVISIRRTPASLEMQSTTATQLGVGIGHPKLTANPQAIQKLRGTSSSVSNTQKIDV